MDYNEILKEARENMGGFCIGCPVCNGKACQTKIPGPGGKGSGAAYLRNFEKLQDIKINMDTIYEGKEVDTTLKIFGKTFAIPVFAAPIGATTLHYGDKISEQEYLRILCEGCTEAGIAAFGGDGPYEGAYSNPVEAIKAVQGNGVPTIKPWSNEVMKTRLKMAEEAGAFAIATDVDASGLALIKNANPPAGPKSVQDLKEFINATDRPVIIKGIMTKNGALKAVEAGASAIVVSNHGGRVLDSTPGTIEVLAEIAEAVGDQVKIFIDGGIRSGLDVFKCIALGADAVLIGRPMATMVYGGGKEAIKTYVDKIRTELVETMEMTGAKSLEEINASMVSKY